MVEGVYVYMYTYWIYVAIFLILVSNLLPLKCKKETHQI